jgi:hypothetical protein
MSQESVKNCGTILVKKIKRYMEYKNISSSKKTFCKEIKAPKIGRMKVVLAG